MRIGLFVFLLCMVSILSPAWAAKARIMVINSYHESLVWVQNHNSAFAEKMSDRADLSYYYMDSKRLPEEKYAALAEECWQEYKRTAPDMVVLTDDDALRLLGKRVMDAGTPVVFLGINQNPRVYLGNMDGATGVLERPLFKRSLIFLQSMFEAPLERCLVLFDDGSISRLIKERVFDDRRSQVVAGVRTDIHLLGRFEDWKEQVLRADRDGYDIIFVGICHSIFDRKGTHIPSEEVMRWTSAHSRVPAFGYWSFSIGKGKMIGGLVLSGKAQGEAAAELAIQVLDGVPPSHVYPVIAKDGDFLFSRYELNRWKLTVPDSFSTPTKAVQFVD